MRVVSLIMVLLMPFLMGAVQDTTSLTNIYAEVTNSPKIIQALESLNGTSGEWAKKAILGDNITGKPIKVMFKVLSDISPAYKNFDALGWKYGDRLVIYINNSHRNTPPEVLACLLSHEAIHQDGASSLTEETQGWTNEAKTWIQMKKMKPYLNNLSENEFSLVYRLNYIEDMYRKANFTNKYIRQEVENNPGYAGLPNHSPGY